ncbi:P2 family phage major capsid protein, partial [Enterobacter hormaechei subsp. steigerwaltii]|nr:P2 family phage major capsid protein [Enterobacter hormaechei subsp. steigerwaltii]MCU3063829.1 P2 family phage major capsid protein [Enterobacter hormaechei subsp. steigerwaltii]MCU3406152.1 P2 family phage major capsid protein [Enterobacter hormaechei subsp. steigerwaltii]
QYRLYQAADRPTEKIAAQMLGSTIAGRPAIIPPFMPGKRMVVMGAMIALGKLLNSNETITPRLVLGRVIVGGGLSLIAGVALYFVPDIHP